MEPNQPAHVRVRVPAKVNLALCVGPVRADGYHPLGTVFQALSLYDDITATQAPTGVFTLEMSGEGSEQLPTDDANLAIRAAKLLAQVHGSNGTRELGVHLSIRKAIPVAGGMAGGSADAAGTLLACAVLWDLDTPPADLQELARALGADVPFPLVGGTALGRGRGDELVPLLSRGCYEWVLAFVYGGLSTPGVFRRFDERGDPGDTSVPAGVLNALAAGDPVALGESLRNDLQAAAVDLRPELQLILDAGRRNGALGAIVSGSGPTCAFLAASESAAMDLAFALAGLPEVRTTKRAIGPASGARLLG